MSEYWRCAFVGEGSSDDGLVPVLEQLLVSLRPGDDFDLAPHHWVSPLHRRSVKAKIQELANEPYDLIFIHRDADNAGMEERINECLACRDKRVVPVVPVRMTEAWVLASLWSTPEFRDWASHKGFRLAQVENMSDPKRVLEEYLNRRRPSRMSQNEFARQRSALIREISIEGDIARLNAWRELAKQVEASFARVKTHLAHT